MREVRIRDTLSGELRTLDPADEIGIYACGPTVYSRIHIGNARPFVVFSLLARFLESEGYRAKLVVNVTDINDKIYDGGASGGRAVGGVRRADDRAPTSRTRAGSASGGPTPSRWRPRRSARSSS